MTTPADNLNCPKCDYNLAGLDLKGTCPECGSNILSTCVRCDYDLTDTDPQSLCPECGTPALASIGQGALAHVDSETLQRVHKGFRTVTVTILIYIATAITTTLLIAFGAASLSAMELRVATVTSAALNHGLTLVILYGWWTLAQPLTQIPPMLDAGDRRSFLRITLALFAVITLLMFPLSFFANTGNQPPTFGIVEILSLVLTLLLYIVMLLSFIAQVRYLNWFARLLRNKKLTKRTKHFVWSGPVIAVLGAPLIFIGPLVTLIIYWNTTEYLRRDLKKHLERRPA
jgi:Zn finger protein HypA/HybF involved in hydrogenase expression